MKQRYYLDTSVFGGFFDSEFKDATMQLFKEINSKQIKIIY